MPTNVYYVLEHKKMSSRISSYITVITQKDSSISSLKNYTFWIVIKFLLLAS